MNPRWNCCLRSDLCFTVGFMVFTTAWSSCTGSVHHSFMGDGGNSAMLGLAFESRAVAGSDVVGSNALWLCYLKYYINYLAMS